MHARRWGAVLLIPLFAWGCDADEPVGPGAELDPTPQYQFDGWPSSIASHDFNAPHGIYYWEEWTGFNMQRSAWVADWDTGNEGGIWIWGDYPAPRGGWGRHCGAWPGPGPEECLELWDVRSYPGYQAFATRTDEGYPGLLDFNDDNSPRQLLPLNDPRGFADYRPEGGWDTYLFVADYGAGTVEKIVWDGNLTHEDSWSEGLVRPVGVATDRAGNVYVTDRGTEGVCGALDPAERILVFDFDGVFLRDFGHEELCDPSDLIVIEDGVVVVAGNESHKIHVFTPGGVLHEVLGTSAPGSANGQFDNPQDVAYDGPDREDGDSYLWITDRDNGRVQRWGWEYTGPPPNTPSGDDVTAEIVLEVDEELLGVAITFTEVEESGQTFVEIVEGVPAPEGFQLGQPPVYYDITTTADVVPPMVVCLEYSSDIPPGQEKKLQLLHFEDGEWVDRTTSHDQGANVICATVDSFSEFVIVVPLETGGSIGDLAWADYDQDGIQDTGEPGLAGVDVELLSDGSVIASTKTGVGGTYEFTGLAAGDYQVRFVLADDQRFSSRDQGTDDAVDSDVDSSTGLSHVVSLAEGEINATIDAGVIELASLTGRVWDDLDRNGVQDEGEPGTPNVDVQLVRLVPFGGGPTERTDANGEYRFDNIWPTGPGAHPPGPHYMLRVVAPTGDSFTDRDAGPDDQDSDVRPFVQSEYPNTEFGTLYPIRFNPGEAKTHVDAGLIRIFVDIGDRVWNDLDRDGIQDDGEPGLEGVKVYLYCAGSTNHHCTSTTTDADGAYLFADLPPPPNHHASSRVRFELPPGSSLTYSPQQAGTDRAADSNADPSNFGLTGPFYVGPGGADRTIDAGMFDGRVTIGDFVWEDRNGNGIQETGEPPLPGIVVNLYLPTAEGPTLVATTTTDASGNYLFVEVDAIPSTDEYTLEFVAPAGWDFTQQNAGGDETIDSDVDANGRVSFWVEPGGDDRDVDAGLQGLGTITLRKKTTPAGRMSGLGGSGVFFYLTLGDAGIVTAGPMGDGDSHTEAYLNHGTYTAFEDDPGPFYDLEIACTDPDGGTTWSKESREATVDLDPGETVACEFHNVDQQPEVTQSLDAQTVQYSDAITPVVFEAWDGAEETVLTEVVEYSVGGGAWLPNVPAGLTLSPAVSLTGTGIIGLQRTLSGYVEAPAGVYSIRWTVTDDDGSASETTTVLTVLPEDATVAFDTDNPVAVQVASAGGNSGLFTLRAQIRETHPDAAAEEAAPGDLSLAVVSMAVTPVGPGSAVSVTCTPAGIVGSGYDAVLTVECAFNNVAVNTYTAAVTVSGGYYTGAAEDVVTVYDPSLGFTTGGGWFYWPGTMERTNFGYTMKYNKKGQKVRGSLLLMRHLPDGTKYRVKSNALYGLALGETTDFGWASFSGKATYLEPGWPDAIGNHEFVVYVEDWGQPGRGADQFWIRVLDRDGIPIGATSMMEPAGDHTETLEGGNIVVPHKPGRR